VRNETNGRGGRSKLALHETTVALNFNNVKHYYNDAGNRKLTPPTKSESLNSSVGVGIMRNLAGLVARKNLQIKIFLWRRITWEYARI